MTSQEYTKEIVQTVYTQLDGNKFTTITGAKVYADGLISYFEQELGLYCYL